MPRVRDPDAEGAGLQGLGSVEGTWGPVTIIPQDQRMGPPRSGSKDWKSLLVKLQPSLTVKSPSPWTNQLAALLTQNGSHCVRGFSCGLNEL